MSNEVPTLFDDSARLSIGKDRACPHGVGSEVINPPVFLGYLQF
jgi:hypothetical protein